jgi:hypothetical protein
MPTLAHHFLLLDLVDNRGTPRTDMARRWWGLTGALWGEMQLRERVMPVRADRFALVPGPLSEGVLGYAESCIQGRYAHSQAWRMQQIYPYAPRMRGMALEELAELGAIRKERDTVLLVPWRTRWPTADGTLEVELVAHLRHWLETVSPDEPPGREDLLLGLLRGTLILESVWAPDEIEQWKDKIHLRTQRAPLGRLVQDLATQGMDMTPYRKRKDAE